MEQEEPKPETIQQAAKRILANNIDGLRDLLKDDDFFYHYKGVIECYGEAMAEWQAEKNSQQTVPPDAKDIEVFAIKPNEDGSKLFAYIGFKIANGNFHFSAVPFTDPTLFNEEEVLNFTQVVLMQYSIGNTNIEQMGLLKETLELFKKKR